MKRQRRDGRVAGDLHRQFHRRRRRQDADRHSRRRTSRRFRRIPRLSSRAATGAPSTARCGSTTPHARARSATSRCLLARLAPADRLAHRPAGARLAQDIGATAIVMDDGLQNPSLAKDCAIAVVDGATGIGNGLTFPSGPLRAPMEAQWPAVDAVIVIGEGVAGERVAREAERHGKKVFTGRLVPDGGEPVPGTAGNPHSRLRGHRPAGEIFRDLARIRRRRGGNPELSGSSRLFGRGYRVAACGSPKRAISTPVTTEKDLARLRRHGVFPHGRRCEVAAGQTRAR